MLYFPFKILLENVLWRSVQSFPAVRWYSLLAWMKSRDWRETEYALTEWSRMQTEVFGSNVFLLLNKVPCSLGSFATNILCVYVWMNEWMNWKQQQ